MSHKARGEYFRAIYGQWLPRVSSMLNQLMLARFRW